LDGELAYPKVCTVKRQRR